jgi:hypothetical protein
MDARMRKAERDGDEKRVALERLRAGLIPNPMTSLPTAVVAHIEEVLEEGRLLLVSRRWIFSIPGYDIVGDRWREGSEEHWATLWAFRGLNDEERADRETIRAHVEERALKAQLNRSFDRGNA